MYPTQKVPDMRGEPVVHLVRVPIGGMTVQQAKMRAKSLGLADTPETRVLVGLEQVDTGWEAVVRFEVGSAGVVATGVEIRSTRGEPLTRVVWDRVRLAERIAEAAQLVAWLGPVTKHPERAQPFETKPQKRGRAKGRPAVYNDDHYRRVGSVYTAARADGVWPVRAVAKAFANDFPGLDNTEDKRPRSWVREARRRGYIAEEETP
jgi:hypothetical protein